MIFLFFRFLRPFFFLFLFRAASSSEIAGDFATSSSLTLVSALTELQRSDHYDDISSWLERPRSRAGRFLT